MQEFEPTSSGDKDFSAKTETPKLIQAKSSTRVPLNLDLPRQSEKDLIKVNPFLDDTLEDSFDRMCL